jgi:hypothetical protein
MEGICPQSGSKDGESNKVRYGDFKAYGYATNRCVCYTDGSGCDCASQNEGLAVRNIATYGPAVVCVDASAWQDYNGGILTSESGCSQKFLDVNHCVQVVGYAFLDESNTNADFDNAENRHSGGGGSKDNRDDSKRQGYWIVRNQWSTAWGYSGYAYVAMGENTCGILNDMIQVTN